MKKYVRIEILINYLDYMDIITTSPTDNKGQGVDFSDLLGDFV